MCSKHLYDTGAILVSAFLYHNDNVQKLDVSHLTVDYGEYFELIVDFYFAARSIDYIGMPPPCKMNSRTNFTSSNGDCLYDLDPVVTIIVCVVSNIITTLQC